MKVSGLIFALFVSAICCSCQDGPRKLGVAWPPGYVYVPRCKALVKYQGNSFEVQGIKVPIPQLGGAAEIGGIKVDPKVLNQAYQTTQILDTSYRNNCELLPSFTTDKAKFEAAVQQMEDSQTKLQQLAMSLAAPVPAAPEKKSETAANPTVTGSPAPGSAAPATAQVAPAASAPARHAVVRKRLTKWVNSYAKKSKTAVVNAPVKSNSTLGLPPAAPTATPHP